MKQQHTPRNQPKIANEQVNPKEGEGLKRSKRAGKYPVRNEPLP